MKNIALLIFICICYSSFGQVIDNRKYSDYNFFKQDDTYVFKYTPTIVVTADTEIYYPKGFEIKLGQPVKYFETESNQYFSFFLAGNQLIFIDTDLDNNKNYCPDTLYIPSIEELIVLSEYQYSYSRYSRNWEKVKKAVESHKKGKIENRKDIVLIRDKCKILLFNIKRENIDVILRFAQIFKRLPSSSSE